MRPPKRPLNDNDTHRDDTKGSTDHQATVATVDVTDPSTRFPDKLVHQAQKVLATPLASAELAAPSASPPSAQPRIDINCYFRPIAQGPPPRPNS